MHCVIIGAGVCGTSAAEMLRKLDPDVEITLIGNEDHPLYSRVMLPHYISGKVPRERVFLKKKEWYAEKFINYRIETVTSLDTKEQRVHLASGEAVSYDKLLIAGGGDVNHLPFPADKLYHLQTIEDADRISSLVPSLSPSAATAIIGGGFISLEFVNIFAQHKANIDMYLRGPLFFSRTFNERASAHLENHLISKGVTIHKRSPVDHIDKEGFLSLQGEFTHHYETPTYPYDAVGVGIGLNSTFPWLEGSGVQTNSGVVCDQTLQTGVRNVWAAGDCAEYYDERLETHLHIGNWMNAQMQGRHVAKNMLGDTAVFDLVSSYATDVLDMDIVAIGDARKSEAQHIIEREYDHGLTQLFIKNGTVRGAVLIDANTDRAAATALIKAQTDISSHREQLADPESPLKDLL